MKESGLPPRFLIDAQTVGPDLDREVARRVFGRTSLRNLPAYSSDDVAAERLLVALEQRRSVHCTFEESDGVWYCVCWSNSDGRRERLASGSAPSRALAFCRAAANLPRTVSASQQARWAKGQTARACEECGSEERMRGRALAVRLCNVCSWRAGKLAMRERDLR